MASKEYYISVGEPWDFTGPDGRNMIKGEIIEFISPQCVIFKTNHVLEIDNVKGNILILFSRYEGEHFDKLEKEGFWTIGGGLLLKDSYKNMNEKELEENSKYIIIGSIQKK